jgi:hypothetical protein
MLITSSVPRSCLGPPRVGAACGLAWNRMGCRGRRLCADLPTPHFSLRGSVSRSQSRAAAEAHLLRCCYGITPGGGCAPARDRRSGEIYPEVWVRAPRSIASPDWKKHPRERRVALCPLPRWQLALRHFDELRSPPTSPVPPLVGVIPARCPVYNVGQVLQWGPLCGPCIGMSTTTCAAVRPRAATGRFGLV